MTPFWPSLGIGLHETVSDEGVLETARTFPGGLLGPKTEKVP